jgi:WD40 repeat protein
LFSRVPLVSAPPPPPPIVQHFYSFTLANMSTDTFEIVVWSVQTGKVLDVLTGHTGPISAVAFNPTSQILASVSW